MVRTFSSASVFTFSSLPRWVAGFLFLGCFFFSLVSKGQVTFQVEKHFYFYNTWGFLKYHHPTFGKGLASADSLFLSFLPAIDNAKTPKEVNAVLLTLLTEVGVPTGEKIAEPKSGPDNSILLQNFDHRWRTRFRFLSGENRKLLAQIFERRFTDEKHHYTYVTNNFYGGLMPHEPVYELPKDDSLPYPLRMLALAKIKAFIDYLYPHKYLMDENWDHVVLGFIPVFSQASTRLDYENALLGINARLDDTHAYAFFRQLHYKNDIFRNNFYPPFDYRIVDKKLLVTQIIDPKLCQKANIQVGDVVVELDDQPIDVWVSALDHLLSVSNPSSLWAKVGEWGDNLLFRSADPEMKVLLLRNGRDFISINLPLMDPSDSDKAKLIDGYFKKRLTPAKKKPGLRWLGQDIVYFQVNDTERLSDDVPLDAIDSRMDSLFTKAQESKGIIFDLRVAPDNSDFVYEHVFRRFGTGDNFFARYYLLNRQTPGTYQLLTMPEAYFPTTFTPQGAAYNGKVVLLVSGSTQGIGEWMAMNLQNLFPQAITLGTQTAGADGDTKKLNLPGNYQLEVTGNAVLYPDMTPTQRRGLKLTQKVETTLKGIQEKRDEVLDEAIELINQE